MKVIGNMKDLKQYIEESLLDDFDTLASNQDKTFEHPWDIFWKDIYNGSDWEGAVKQLENIITIDAKKVSSEPNLKRGEVFVTFYVSNRQVFDKLTRIHVGYNRKDFEILWKNGDIVGARNKSFNFINIMPLVKSNNKPHISVIDDPTTDNCPGYVLSKKQSAKAIDMLKKIAKEDWTTY